MVVLAFNAPLAPFTVSEYGPAATPDPTPIVTAEDPVVGFVPKVPAMPAGQPEAVKVTAELNPFKGATVTVDVPLAPATAAAAVALRVKPGTAAGDLQSERPVCVADLFQMLRRLILQSQVIGQVEVGRC